MREKTNVVKLEFMMYGNAGTDIQRDILDKIASQVDWLKENAAIFSLKMRPDRLCYETEFQEFGDFCRQSETWVDVFRIHISLLQDLKKNCNLEYALVYVIEFYGNLLPGFSLSDSLIQLADQIRLSSIDFDIYYHVLSSDTEILPPRGPRWIFRQVDLKTRLYERNNGPNRINLLLEVIGEGAEEICSTGFQSSVFKRGDLNPYRKNTSSSDEIAWFYEVGFQESDDIGEAFAELLLVFRNQTDRLRQWKEHCQIRYRLHYLMEIRRDSSPVMVIEEEMIRFASRISAGIRFDIINNQLPYTKEDEEFMGL